MQLSKLPWASVSTTPRVQPHQDETLITTFDTHWIKYVKPVCKFVVVGGLGAALLLFAGDNVSSSPLANQAVFFVGLLLLGFSLHWLFRRLLSETMEDVYITNKRFIFLENHLWSTDEMHEILLERIRAVEANKRGVVQNVLRYGTLWFDTGGSSEQEGYFTLIPHPHRKAKLITDLLQVQ